MKLFPRVLLVLLVAFSFVKSAMAESNGYKWDYLGIEGRGYIICDAILKRVNSYKWEGREETIQDPFPQHDIALTYSRWKEPPWEDVDAERHRGLILELRKYASLGADLYFGRKQDTRTSEAKRLQDEHIHRLATERPFRLRVWRVHLLKWLYDKPAPPALQTVVQLLFERPSTEIEAMRKKHPDKPIVSYVTEHFIVTDDLRGPHPGVSAWHAREIAKPVKLFDGVPHFVWGSVGTLTISRDFGSGPTPFCTLEFGTGRGGKSAEEQQALSTVVTAVLNKFATTINEEEPFDAWG